MVVEIKRYKLWLVLFCLLLFPVFQHLQGQSPGKLCLFGTAIKVLIAALLCHLVINPDQHESGFITRWHISAGCAMTEVETFHLHLSTKQKQLLNNILQIYSPRSKLDFGQAFTEQGLEVGLVRVDEGPFCFTEWTWMIKHLARLMRASTALKF